MGCPVGPILVLTRFPAKREVGPNYFGPRSCQCNARRFDQSLRAGRLLGPDVQRDPPSCRSCGGPFIKHACFLRRRCNRWLPSTSTKRNAPMSPSELRLADSEPVEIWDVVARRGKEGVGWARSREAAIPAFGL